MDAEKLALFEKCYRNWNGTSVMEGAFKELLGECGRLRAALTEIAGYRTRGVGCNPETLVNIAKAALHPVKK